MNEATSVAMNDDTKEERAMSAAALKKLNVGNKKQKEEERECTFTPKIGSKSRKMNKDKPSGLKRHEHLYEKAVEQQKKLQEKRESFIDENCTFKPRMSTGNSKIAKKVAKKIAGENRYDRMHAESVKIKKKVEEMRKKRESSVGTFTPKISSKAKKLKSRPSLAARPVSKNHYAEKEKKRRELQKSREMKNCTFRPQLNKKKNKKVGASSFMERLTKSNEAKAARMKRLQEEKEKRLQSQMGARRKKSAKTANFDRLYKTGNIKDRLERAKKIKEAEYAKHTFKPNVGRRKAQNTSSAGSIHERLHQAAARRSAQRKAAMQKKAEEEEKKFATKKKKKKSSTSVSDVYSRLIGRAEQERERREALRQKKIAMEMEQCQTNAKRKARSGGGKPYWERFYERRNETETNTLMTSEERELKEHCTGKPKLSETSNKLSSSHSGGKKVWQRLLDVDRREIEKRREEEKLAREKALIGQAKKKKKKKSDGPSVYARLIQRAEETAKQRKSLEEGDRIVRPEDFLTRTSKVQIKKKKKKTKKKKTFGGDAKPPVAPTTQEEAFEAF